MKQRAIYKFSRFFGRAGDLSGVFVATPEEVAAIVGREVRFGEVLGKHSEVSAVMQTSDFTFVSDDETFVALFDKHDLATGTNPVGVAAYNAEEDAEIAAYEAKRAAT